MMSNPTLVDMVIDLLEVGVDQPLALSEQSEKKIGVELKSLRRSESLLDNVLGLLELAQHADDYALYELAAALRRIAETSTDDLINQTERHHARQRAQLGFEPPKVKLPAAPAADSIKVGQLCTADVRDVHLRRSRKLTRRLNRREQKWEALHAVWRTA